MANAKTGIQWTDATWSPVTGCSHVSPGCEHCYAEALSLRFGHSRHPWGAQYAAENVVLHPDRLDQPLKWRKPKKIFVNSMSDLFHEQVPFEFIDRVFMAICECRGRHAFQILTKRPERMLEWFEHAKKERSGWFSPYTGRLDLWQTWFGVSVEDQRRANERLPILVQVPARVLFVSYEPALGPVDFTRVEWPGTNGHKVDVLRGGYWDERWGFTNHSDIPGRVNWVICGGESGPHHRPFDPDWARSARDQCQAAGVPFFFKQHGGLTPKAGGDTLDGVQWHQFPEAHR